MDDLIRQISHNGYIVIIYHRDTGMDFVVQLMLLQQRRIVCETYGPELITILNGLVTFSHLDRKTWPSA